jgi:hypothetical protein
MAEMTPDCVFEDTSPPDGARHVGTDAVRAAWEKLFAASPDAVFTTASSLILPASNIGRSVAKEASQTWMRPLS